IEVPSAAITADLLAKEVDFFSIGTNDLIQYSMAVDRVNEKIAYLYKPTHPAVLRLIRSIVDAGHKHNIWVGVCGEMASEPALALLLMGLGVDELSCSSVAIPELKKVFRSMRYTDIENLLNIVMEMNDPDEIHYTAQKLVNEYVPTLMHF
ncbi:phosphoenolpyruvate--protein phosphotransferase, partial [bacterium]|nr:phosphoenolpyruvate--protein phosphotransferase [bacterium]